MDESLMQKRSEGNQPSDFTTVHRFEEHLARLDKGKKLKEQISKPLYKPALEITACQKN